MTKHLAVRFALTASLVWGLTFACKRRVPSVSAAPSATAPDPPAAVLAPPAEPLEPYSAVVPSSAVYADGGAPNGYDRASVWEVVPAGDGAAVLLVDSTNTMVLPIYIGGTEALTIRLRMDAERYERPLTHDLLSSLVRELGGHAVKAHIDELRDDTFIGSVFVRQGERVLQLDARPSDAIAIALGSGAPLYVSRSVLLTSAVSRKEIEKEQKEQEMGKRRRGNPTSL